VKDKPAVEADLYIEDTEKNIIALRGSGHPTIAFGYEPWFPWRALGELVRHRGAG